MNLVRFQNPRYTANRVLVDELFNNFFRNDYHEGVVSNCTSEPATNVFETGKEFRIEVMLPGYNKEDVQLNYKNSLLSIKVDRKEEKEEKNEEYKYVRREFGARNFEKQFRVPKSVDVEKISAEFKNGILNVILPKKEEALEKAPFEIKIS